MARLELTQQGWINYPMARFGRYIVFEGPDGSGTSTQVCNVQKKLYLSERRHNIFTTRQPSDGPIGVLIRMILSRRLVTGVTDDLQFDPRCMLSLWQADRYHHVATDVIPNLKRGKLVLQDRYWYSTLCYQPEDGVDQDEIIKAHERFIVPDMVLLFDLDVAVAAQRRGARSVSEERYEQDELQSRITDRYRQLPALLPDHPFRIIDASRSIDEVTEQCMTVLKEILPYEGKPGMFPL